MRIRTKILSTIPVAIALFLSTAVSTADDYDSSAVRVGEKTWKGQTWKVFRDKDGRELGFNGFNISGEVKLLENGFLPFASDADARSSFRQLREKTGSNIVRFTVSWEGLQKSPGVLDRQWARKAIRYIEIAIQEGLYVLVDWHQDNYTRHTYRPDSKYTGNGAPAWAVTPLAGNDRCGLLCEPSWITHAIFDPAVRSAVRGFWWDFQVLEKDITNISLKHESTNTCIKANKVSVFFGLFTTWPLNRSTCSSNNADNKWVFNKDGRVKLDSSENLCMDVRHALNFVGNSVEGWPCNGTQAQRFAMDAEGRIHSALDLNRCVVSEPAGLRLANCNQRQQNQTFTLLDIDDRDANADVPHIQSEFIWQVGEFASLMKEILSSSALSNVIGFEPMNEPIDGGLGSYSYADFDNLQLWPFYKRIRTELNNKGLGNWLVFAEPLLFFNFELAPVISATGGGHLTEHPGEGFVFTPHYYDALRQTGINPFVVENAGYFDSFDTIRNEQRFLDMPVFLSEFGMFNSSIGPQDSQRVVGGVRQAMQLAKGRGSQSRRPDFFSPYISGSQWQWDIYYDKHHELINGNPNRLDTTLDAWNGENFSVINAYGAGYNVNSASVEIAYPRAIQGDLMHAVWEGQIPDAWGRLMDWHAIRADIDGPLQGEVLLQDTRFYFVTWRGRNSNKPSEILLPKSIETDELIIITETGLFEKFAFKAPQTSGDTVVKLISDSDASPSATRLIVHDKGASVDEQNTMHFVLAIDGANNHFSERQLKNLREEITRMIKQEKNPLWLTGLTTYGGHEPDA